MSITKNFYFLLALICTLAAIATILFAPAFITRYSTYRKERFLIESAKKYVEQRNTNGKYSDYRIGSIEHGIVYVNIRNKDGFYPPGGSIVVGLSPEGKLLDYVDGPF